MTTMAALRVDPGIDVVLTELDEQRPESDAPSSDGAPRLHVLVAGPNPAGTGPHSTREFHVVNKP